MPSRLPAVDSASQASGAPVVLRPGTNSFTELLADPDQAWVAVDARIHDDDGLPAVYMFVQHSGMCLTRQTDDAGRSVIVQRPYGPSSDQIWTLVGMPGHEWDAVILTSLAELVPVPGHVPVGAAISVINSGTATWPTLFNNVVLALRLTDAHGQPTYTCYDLTSGGISAAPGQTVTIKVPAPYPDVPRKRGVHRGLADVPPLLRGGHNPNRIAIGSCDRDIGVARPGRHGEPCRDAVT